MPKPIGAKVKPPAGAPATAPPPPAGPPLDPAVAAAREELASAEKKRAALVDELRHVEKQVRDVYVGWQRRERGVGGRQTVTELRSTCRFFLSSLRFTTSRPAT